MVESSLKRVCSLSLGLFILAVAAGGCGSEAPAPDTGGAGKNAAADGASGLPPGAEPMGRTAPGYFTVGPSGDVWLRMTSPKEGELLDSASLSASFEIKGFPIYFDAERKKGQSIHVIVDDEPYVSHYEPDKPFNPEVFKTLKSGTHTIRAFPVREWHESIKEPGGSAFAFAVFSVKSRTAGLNIDKTAPLLTYSTPTGEYRWKQDARGVMLDFYVTNATIGINDYKVKYTIGDRPPRLLTSWEPVWWKWDELAPGDYRVTLELVDNNNKPVPFRVGNRNYNRTVRTFKILAQGEQPSDPSRR